MNEYTNVGMDVHARSVPCKALRLALRSETGELFRLDPGDVELSFTALTGCAAHAVTFREGRGRATDTQMASEGCSFHGKHLMQSLLSDAIG